MRVSLKNKVLAAQPSLQGTYCLSKAKFHGVDSWTSFKDKKSIWAYPKKKARLHILGQPLHGFQIASLGNIHLCVYILRIL